MIPERTQQLSDGTSDAKGGRFLSLIGGDTVRREVATTMATPLSADFFSGRANQFIDIDVPGRALP